MSAPAYLECDACGGEALWSQDGLFHEGAAEYCADCGAPGHVVVDEDGTAWWSTDGEMPTPPAATAAKEET